MALLRTGPFGDIQRVFDDAFPLTLKRMDDMPVDVYEDDGHIVAELHIPGLKAEDIDVYVEDELLRVVAKREEIREVNKEDFITKEIRRGAFTRVVGLPGEVKEDSVDAVYENGVLRVWMEKT